MSRLALALLAFVAALAGCSSGNNLVYEQLGPLVQEQLFGGPVLGKEEPTPAPGELTRAQVQEIPYAMITVRVGENPKAFVVPVADNGGYLVYQDQARRGVVMNGGLVTATHGFAYDLDAVSHRREDPVVVPTPLPQWPPTVERNYAFTIRGQQSYEIAVVCAFHRGVREFIEIVELRFEVVRMVETCRNPERSFVNTYWASPDTGFIWKSEQWVGPRQPPFTIEIVTPYGPS